LPYIETERLKLVTFSKAMMEEILENNLEKLPFQPAHQWPMKVYLDIFPYKIKRFNEVPDEAAWEGIIIHKIDQFIIGDMGFKGGPNTEGMIDIGYSIVPNYQGYGYATEMGKALVEWGLSQQEVKKVVATCNPDNIASIRVLEKIGLHITNKTKEKIYWST